MYISSNPILPIRSLLGFNGNCAPEADSDSGRRVYRYSRAREALADFVRTVGMKPGDSVLLPAYICSAVLEPFATLGIKLLFYPLDESFAPDVKAVRELLMQKPRAILLVHYFGFAPEVDGLIEDCRQQGLWIIEDCAHTLPEKDRPFPGDLVIYSLAKLLPVPDGALAIINNPDLDWPEIPTQPNKRLTRTNSLWQFANTTEVIVGMSLRTRLRNSRRTTRLITDLRTPPESRGERDQYGRFRMSRIAQWINSKIDLQSVIKARKENYRLLVNSIKSVKGVRIVFGDREPSSAPLGLPILVENRELVRSRLISAGVDPRPIWSGLPPCVPSSFSTAHHIAAHNIVLPVHQDLTPRSLLHVAMALGRAVSS
jgi:hypothetical protein